MDIGGNISKHESKLMYKKNYCQLYRFSSSSLKGPPGLGGSAGRAAPVALPCNHPDDGLLQHARPHVGQVHLQLGGDEGEANLEARVPLEAGSTEAHPANEA